MTMVEDFSGGDTFGSLFRKNRRLSRELARIESVFNAINSAIVVVDERGVISFANAFAKRKLCVTEPYYHVPFVVVQRRHLRPGQKSEISEMSREFFLCSYSGDHECDSVRSE